MKGNIMHAPHYLVGLECLFLFLCKAVGGGLVLGNESAFEYQSSGDVFVAFHVAHMLQQISDMHERSTLVAQ